MGVQAINLAARQYMDEAGNLWPITKYFDANGQPCEWQEAFSAVAGEGRDWFAIKVTEFDGRPS